MMGHLDIKRYAYLDKEIKMLQQERTELRRLAVLASRIGLERDEPSAIIKKDKADKCEKLIGRLDDRLLDYIKELIEKKEKIMNFLSSFTNTRERLILSLRMLKGESWEHIANELGGDVSADSIRMTAKRALDRMKGQKGQDALVDENERKAGCAERAERVRREHNKE